MPQPTINQVHINTPLTNVSVGYMQAQTQFVSTRVFPIVPVDKQSDAYYVYTKNDWFRDEAAPRAPATESAGSGYGVSNTTYTANVYAIHKDIPDQIRKNADSVFNLDRDATLFVTSRLLLRQEIQWTADFFTTGVWATDNTTAVKWSDYANSDPVGDIRTAILAVQSTTGFKPNKLVLGAEVFVKLIDHPDIVARVQGGSTTGMPALVNEEMLARIFGLDEVIVAGAIKATNAEGATETYAFIQGKSALLVYAPPSPGPLTPSAGYTFSWKGVSGGLGQPVAISSFRMEHLKVTRVEGEIAFSNKLIGSDLGYFFSAIVI